MYIFFLNLHARMHYEHPCDEVPISLLLPPKEKYVQSPFLLQEERSHCNQFLQFDYCQESPIKLYNVQPTHLNYI